MARLVSPPIIISSAMRALHKPIVGRPTPRCAPKTSVKSRIPLRSQAVPFRQSSVVRHPALRLGNTLSTISKLPRLIPTYRTSSTISTLSYEKILRTNDRLTSIPRPCSITAKSRSRLRTYRTLLNWSSIGQGQLKLQKRKQAPYPMRQSERLRAYFADLNDSTMSAASDNNPDLLQDESFDETKEEQGDAATFINQFSRKIAGEKTMMTLGRIAQCPQYLGNCLTSPRRREHVPLLLSAPAVVDPTPEKELKSQSISHLPRPRIPVRKVSARLRRISVGAKPIPRTARPIRKTSMAPKVAPVRKTSNVRKSSPLPKDPTVSKSKSIIAFKTSSTPAPQVLKKSTVSNLKSCLKKSKNIVKVQQGASIAQCTLSMDKNLARVHFLERPFRHRYYDVQDPATVLLQQSCDSDEWTVGESKPDSYIVSPSRGFDKIFESTSSMTISLKKRVVTRFKSVRAYVDRCEQEPYANGNAPYLHQREYGNADYKIATDARDYIAESHLGVVTHSGNNDARFAGMRHASFVIFDAFQDPFGRLFESVTL